MNGLKANAIVYIQATFKWQHKGVMTREEEGSYSLEDPEEWIHMDECPTISTCDNMSVRRPSKATN